MADAASDFPAIAETTCFLHHFKDMPDKRQAGKVDYPLPEILLLRLLAVLAGAETFCDIARFGEKKKVTRETRFYIASLALPADAIGPMIRAHWAIENTLHWVMDMVFRDDECRVRTENAPANFVTLKHMAHNLARKAPGKDSIRLRRKTASWDDEYLVSLIAA